MCVVLGEIGVVVIEKGVVVVRGEERGGLHRRGGRGAEGGGG